ncbi:MAG: hypothetical protein CMJ18_08990 [Phycisphaeraceae bacterium]|nr:hypothetical protein [Phycisphaeraceae bacterium]
MKLVRILADQLLQPPDVLFQDRILEGPHSTIRDRLDMHLQLRPIRKAVLPGDPVLRLRQRRAGAVTEQVTGLVSQMTQIGAIGQALECAVRELGRHADLLAWSPDVRNAGRKEVQRWIVRQAGGFLPFPRTGCVLHAPALSHAMDRRQGRLVS